MQKLEHGVKILCCDLLLEQIQRGPHTEWVKVSLKIVELKVNTLGIRKKISKTAVVLDNHSVTCSAHAPFHSCWTCYGDEVVQRTKKHPMSLILSQALIFATVSCVFTFSPRKVSSLLIIRLLWPNYSARGDSFNSFRKHQWLCLHAAWLESDPKGD